MYRYFRRVAGVGSGNYIYFWKSKGLSDENIAPHATNEYYSLNPNSTYFGAKTRAEFKGSCLKQDKIMHTLWTIVNIYIGCEISKNFPISSYPTLENRLFGAVSLTKNVDIDKYKYSGYGIGFDRKGKFSVGIGFGRNCIIFGEDMSSSVHVIRWYNINCREKIFN